jgi:hypothetical protein
MLGELMEMEKHLVTHYNGIIKYLLFTLAQKLFSESVQLGKDLRQ